jgi:thermitase
LLGLASPLRAFAAPPAAANQTQYVPGHLLIQQRAGLSEAEVDKALKAHGGKRIGKIDRINLHLVQLPAQANTEAIAAALARNKHFKFVELDRIFAPAGTTNDPSLASQWHLAKIGAPTAWDSLQPAGTSSSPFSTPASTAAIPIL